VDNLSSVFVDNIRIIGVISLPANIKDAGGIDLAKILSIICKNCGTLFHIFYVKKMSLNANNSLV
jgi:hypothetical protein